MPIPKRQGLTYSLPKNDVPQKGPPRGGYCWEDHNALEKEEIKQINGEEHNVTDIRLAYIECLDGLKLKPGSRKVVKRTED